MNRTGELPAHTEHEAGRATAHILRMIGGWRFRIRARAIFLAMRHRLRGALRRVFRRS